MINLGNVKSVTLDRDGEQWHWHCGCQLFLRDQQWLERSACHAHLNALHQLVGWRQ